MATENNQDQKLSDNQELLFHAKRFDSLLGDSFQEILKPPPSTTISRLPKFDSLIDGLRPNEFTILCGATGVGKTTLCANISASLVFDEVPHFVASVETGHIDYVRRVMSAMTGVNFLKRNGANLRDVESFFKQYSSLLVGKNHWASLHDNRFSVHELMQDLETAHTKHGCKIAIIDNLNFFLEVTAASETIVVMDRVIHELIMFSKRTPIHIIMVCHPKKTDHGRVESEFDIKGSSTAVQEAHNVILFNKIRKDWIQSDSQKFFREIKFAKLRKIGENSGKVLLLDVVNGVKYLEQSIVED